MGFPAGYTDVLIPKLLINALSFLGLLRGITVALLSFMGLSGFVEPDYSARPEPISSAHHHPADSLSATLIREMLPVEEFSGDGPGGPACCAVCLYEYEEGDEIRRMRNCRHMFHRGCVDRWIEHDRKTCPLCRKPFVPEELQEDFNQKIWDASGIPDFYSEYSHITNFL